MSEIKCFKDQNEDILYYSFFDSITFGMIQNEDKTTLKNVALNDCHPSDVYYAHFFNEDKTKDDVSKALRGSTTLNIDENNSYISKNIKVVFAEKGFVFCELNDKYNYELSFNRILLKFLLSLAYNTHTEQLLSNVTEAYNKLDYKKMISLRDEIYAFGLKSFFHNPVKQNRHESFELWNMISKTYYVEIKHNEMKSQITDLTGVIETKYKDEQEAKGKRVEKILGILGFILALTSLVSVFKDLKEFGLF